MTEEERIELETLCDMAEAMDDMITLGDMIEE